MKKAIIISLSALSLSATAYAVDHGSHANKGMNSDMQQERMPTASKDKKVNTNPETRTKISKEMNNAKENSNKPYARNQSEIAVGKESKDFANSTNTSTNTAANTKMNNNRNEVKGIQTSLKNNGYDLSVDGYMGQETTTAIRSFQKDNNMEATGKLDSKTRTALMGNSPDSSNEDY